MIRHIHKLAREQRGTVVIETAIVAPVLLLMGLGAFEASNIFARQVELQDAAGEAFQIAVAAPPASTDEMATLKSIISASTGLKGDQISLQTKYRCGTDANYVDDSSECPGSYAHFVQINLTDTYQPMWSKIAFGSNINYKVTRLVQIG